MFKKWRQEVGENKAQSNTFYWRINTRDWSEEQEAEALVSFVDGKIKDNNEVNLKVLATKEDISLLKLDISNLKSEILKWMVGLFIPLYLTIVGLIITMLLKH